MWKMLFLLLSAALSSHDCKGCAAEPGGRQHGGLWKSGYVQLLLGLSQQGPARSQAQTGGAAKTGEGTEKGDLISQKMQMQMLLQPGF